MTIVQTKDTRNQEWRDSNVGSKMLAKMGWTEGSGIGKRNVNTTALRAIKRQEGLGIGAKRQTEGGPSESTGTFAAVLANLQAHHGTSASTKSKKSSKKEAKKAKKAAKKASKKGLSLPQNKVLAGHARKMRAAKFGAKSAQDLACIFGNTEVVDTALGGASPFGTVPAVTSTSGSPQKRPRPTPATKEEPEESSSSSSSETDEDPPKVAAARACSSDSDESNVSKERPTKKKRKKAKEAGSGQKAKKNKSKKDKKKKKSKND